MLIVEMMVAVTMVDDVSNVVGVRMRDFAKEFLAAFARFPWGA